MQSASSISTPFNLKLDKIGKTVLHKNVESTDLKSVGLLARLILRMKLFTLDHRLIINKLGTLALFDQEAVSTPLIKKGKVLVIKPLSSLYLIENTKSRFGVLRGFLDGFEKACKRHDIKTKRVSLEAMSHHDLVQQVKNDKPDATFGFNVVLDRTAFLDETGVPHIACITDCATYYFELFNIPETISCFMDEDSCKLFEGFGRKDTIFLPHAIDRDLLSKPLHNKRDLEVVMTGSYFDAEVLELVWQEFFPQDLIDVLKAAAKLALSSTSLPHFLALHQVLAEKPEVASYINDSYGIIEISNMLERYIRAVDRTQLVEACINHFDVHVFSSAEDMPKWTERYGSKLHVHEECPYEKLFDLFSRSKFVLNSVPTIKHGLHERLLTSVAAGAVSVSFDTEFLEHTLPKSQSIILYKPSDMEGLISQMKNADFGRDEKLCSLIAQKHTWDDRVEHIMQVYRPQKIHP